MKKIKTMALILGAMAAMSASVLAAADNGSLTISADRMTYDGATGRASVDGDVVIIKDDKTMTGASGWYDVKSGEASLSGGVSMIGSNTSMAAESIHSYNNTQLEATGNVHLQKDDRQIFGDKVTYNTESGYGQVNGSGRLVVGDSVLTGDSIEGWLNEIRAVANGNVTLSSPSKNVSASADQATYTQTPGQNDGVAYLTGNAHAVQNGNVLNAPELRLQLSDNSAETIGGRSTLIIAPK